MSIAPRPRLTVVLAAALAAGISGPLSATTPPPPGTPPLLLAFHDYVEDLNLTPVQRDEIKAVFKSHSARLLLLLQQEAQSRTSLQTAIHEVPSSPSTISRASAAVSSADQGLAIERSRIYAEIYPILNEQQRTRTAEFLSEARSQVEARFLAARDRLQEAIESDKSFPVLERLNLSPAQKQALKALYHEHQPVIAGLLQRERMARSVLVAAIRKPSVDALGVIRASGAVAEIDVELAQERARIWTEVSNVLTLEQREQLEEGRQRVQKLVQAALRSFVTFLFELMS